MNTEKEIPEEIKELIEARLWELFPYDYDDDAHAMKMDNKRNDGRKAARALYAELAPEIASLKAERGAYRKALEDLKKVVEHSTIHHHHLRRMAANAFKTLDQYPSPKE